MERETEPVNYSPNNLNGNCPRPIGYHQPPCVCQEGYIARTPIVKQNDFFQAGQFYQGLSEAEQIHLCENIASELCQCRKQIVERVTLHFRKACPEWGWRVQKYVRRLR